MFFLQTYQLTNLTLYYLLYFLNFDKIFRDYSIKHCRIGSPLNACLYRPPVQALHSVKGFFGCVMQPLSIIYYIALFNGFAI